MFSIDIIDAKGNESRGTFFGQAVDMFYPMLQERQLYSFTGGKAKKGDKRFCSFDWEITFDERSTKIAPVHDNGVVPQMVFDFKSLSSLDQLVPGSNLDAACVVAEVEPVSEVHLKAGGSKLRQNVTLLDESGASCRLSLWGEFCDTPWQAGSVALLKGVRVSDYGGRSLNTLGGTSVVKDADAMAAHSRAQELSDWYRTSGANALSDARQLSNDRGSSSPAQTIEEVKAEAQELDAPNQAAGNGPGAANGKLQGYHTVVPATITFIPHERPPFYMACSHEVPDERNEGKMRLCNRKVEQNGGSWTCSADHQCQHPTARWIAQFLVADWSGGQYVSSFDEQGQKILGCPASEAARLWDLKETDTTMANQLETLFKSALFKRWRIRIKSKKEIWMDEERIKMSAVELAPLDFVKEARSKLDEVARSLAALG